LTATSFNKLNNGFKSDLVDVEAHGDQAPPGTAWSQRRERWSGTDPLRGARRDLLRSTPWTSDQL